MLVLSRRLCESILFDLPSGETITVKVNRIDPANVRLVISAPLNINVRRGELPPPVDTKHAEPCDDERPMPAEAACDLHGAD